MTKLDKMRQAQKRTVGTEPPATVEVPTKTIRAKPLAETMRDVIDASVPLHPDAAFAEKPDKPKKAKKKDNPLSVCTCGHKRMAHFCDQGACQGLVEDKPCSCAGFTKASQQAPDPNSKRQQRKHGSMVKGRLPDGAKFEVAWDEQEQTWRGSLTIGDKVFRQARSAVFRLMEALDTMYRDWEAAEKRMKEGDGT